MLVMGTEPGVIPASMQLIAGRTAQAYNLRKKRKGAYWEDRYHATAIESDQHLFQCLVYIDMNMVRAGVVNHPDEWKHSGYHEIQIPPERYAIIDHHVLVELGGFQNLASLQQTHRGWINTQIKQSNLQRQPCWTDGVAVGSEHYVKNVKDALGVRASSKKCQAQNDHYILKEPETAYNNHFAGQMEGLSD